MHTGCDDDLNGDCPQSHGVIGPSSTFYGCYCGKGNDNPGKTSIDPLDKMCEHHDNCYGNVDPPCEGMTTKTFGIPTGFEPDPRAECRSCDRAFCCSLNPSRCNRYDSGSSQYLTCASYTEAARITFKCNAFGM